MLRPPMAVSGAPNSGIPLNRPLAGTALRLVLGNVAAARRISGAAVAQPCGTDNPPTVEAWPKPADTPGPPSGPDADTRPSAPGTAGTAAAAGAAAEAAEEAPTPIAPEPQTLPMMPPSAQKPSVVATDVAISEIEGRVTLDVALWIAPSPVCAVDASGVASPWSACGAADISWPVDMIACACPADVPTAWLTASACPASPAGLVVSCWGVNGVNVEALAEEAA